MQARAFAEADARGSLDAYAKAVAKAINEGGEPVMQVRDGSPLRGIVVAQLH